MLCGGPLTHAAVCGAGGFYLAPATNPNRTKIWVILLEGGQWCWDAQSCGIRSQQNPALTTSGIWPPHMSQTGIFNANPKRKYVPRRRARGPGAQGRAGRLRKAFPPRAVGGPGAQGRVGRQRDVPRAAGDSRKAFLPPRSAFAGANLVYAGYCSSDAWVGNAGAESNSFGWAFRGQHHIEALIATLSEPCPVVIETRIHFLNRTHLDVNTTYTAEPLGAGSRLLFSGCSAGGRGAMFNIDYVAAMLPPGVELRGFFDSPLWVDVLPFESNITSLENETQTIFPLINATGRLSPACAAAYPGAESWKCLYGAYRIPFVQTTFLMSASQFDRYQLPWNEGTMPPYTGAALTYANAFQRAVRAVVLDLPTAAQAGSAIYSSACFKHCTTMLGAFWGVKVNGWSLNDYLALWYFGSKDPETHVNPADGGAATSGLPAGVSDQHIEACLGFGCGECHSRTPSAGPPLPPAYATSLIPGNQAVVPGGPPSPRAFERVRTARASSAGGGMRSTALAVGGGVAAAAVLLGCAVAVAGGGKGPPRRVISTADARLARETSPLLQRNSAVAVKTGLKPVARAPPKAAAESPAAASKSPPPPRGAVRSANPVRHDL
jgi:hypothetical protein